MCLGLMFLPSWMAKLRRNFFRKVFLGGSVAGQLGGSTDVGWLKLKLGWLSCAGGLVDFVKFYILS